MVSFFRAKRLDPPDNRFDDARFQADQIIQGNIDADVCADHGRCCLAIHAVWAITRLLTTLWQWQWVIRLQWQRVQESELDQIAKAIESQAIKRGLHVTQARLA